MSEKVKNHFKKQWSTYVAILVICVITGIAQIVCFHMWEMDIDAPMSYTGGDEMSILQNAQALEHQDWILSTDRLGAPFGTNFSDFTSSLLHNVGNLVLKFFVMVSRNAAMATNLTYLSIFYMAAIISYFVMRHLKISNWVSVAASLAFGFSPYIVMRNFSHIVLSECYFIPLSMLLCIWVYEDDDFLKFDKNFFKTPRNYFAIFFMLLIANNGIAYYPFFTCFMLIVTAISKAVKDGKLKSVVSSIKCIIGTCFFVVLAIVPQIINTLQNGGNSDAISRGGFMESEIYGLKIIQLFLPVSSHHIEIIGNAIDLYNSESPFINENMTSYIGLVGIMGFIVLMFSIFIKKKSLITQRLGLLAELNVMLIFLGVSGGFGTIFAFIISDKLRGYNRISIFIAYVCILAFALWIDYVYKKWKEKNSNPKFYSKEYILAAVVSVFCVLAMFEGFNPAYRPDYSTNAYNYQSDDKFVKNIEANVSEAAMIYQLPYQPYPEGGSVNDMWDYHLFIGFIHSDKLKWSYGSIKGRDTDVWNKSISLMDYPEMVSTLKETGFEGIYIDRRAYLADDLKELETQLEDVIGHAPEISDNKNLSFFKF